MNDSWQPASYGRAFGQSGPPDVAATAANRRPVFISRSDTETRRRAALVIAVVTAVWAVSLAALASELLSADDDPDVQPVALSATSYLPPGVTEKELPADGISSLPNDSATVSYEPLPGQSEWLRHFNARVGQGSDSWYLAWEGATREEGISLARGRRGDGGGVEALRADIAGQKHVFTDSDGRPAAVRSIRVDGRPAFSVRYTFGSSDMRVLRLWIAGRLSNFSFDCHVERYNAQYWRQCNEMAKALKIRG